MLSSLSVWLRVFLAVLLAGLVSFLTTPPVRRLAQRLGAIDAPDGERRINTSPVPRMGGLAIYAGFVTAVLILCRLDRETVGMLAGSVLIAAMGALDDVYDLPAWAKLLFQLGAALVAYFCGIVFAVISNPIRVTEIVTIPVGLLSLPITVLWIVGCTNAVNLIDGLDGLAAGVSAISSLTMLVVSLFVSEPAIAVILAALTGACIGFIPYNINPAKIFMGDLGSQVLGYLLSVLSILGLFKFHAIVTFFVPLLALAFPIADTAFAFCRRILRGQNPMKADRSHLHHRLLAIGLNQKQAVAVLYSVSALLGLIAVVLTGRAAFVRIVCLVLAVAVTVLCWLFVRGNSDR